MIRSFLMGGVLGAAAAIYLNQSNNRAMLMANMGKMTNSMSDMFDTATEKMKEITFEKMTNNMDGNFNDITAGNDDQGMEQIQQIINEDPDVKAESEKILEENDSSITQ
ncbi:hypothetical protein [Chengkuizengella axinellae]|uniref:YtxH domain-containing protein n=1 Tax=Chengkuizengella axinellae TaxID=3064388 RepID=A0ABT9IWN6_9BACL|nr:hypothetical protein [Chengkuizengella sp. 2205SS18-9]MDP5273771.1 hypothetical protein [Chengkuizengella sp. 2205SS18-9]